MAVEGRDTGGDRNLRGGRGGLRKPRRPRITLYAVTHRMILLCDGQRCDTTVEPSLKKQKGCVHKPITIGKKVELKSNTLPNLSYVPILLSFCLFSFSSFFFVSFFFMNIVIITI